MPTEEKLALRENWHSAAVTERVPERGRYMPQLSDRVGTFTDSVIRRMTRINNQYDSINLPQGFPDFDPPKQLLNEAIRRLEKLSALLA